MHFITLMHNIEKVFSSLFILLPLCKMCMQNESSLSIVCFDMKMSNTMKYIV